MRIKRDPRSHGDSHVFFLYDSAKVLGLKMALLSLLWHFRGGQEDKEDLERTPTIDDTYDYRPQPNKDDTHLITSSKVTPTISSDIPIHLSLPVQLTHHLISRPNLVTCRAEFPKRGDIPQMQVHGTAILLEHSLNPPIQLDSPVCRLKELKLLLTRRNIILGLIEFHLACFIPSPHSYLQVHFYLNLCLSHLRDFIHTYKQYIVSSSLCTFLIFPILLFRVFEGEDEPYTL